MPKELERNLYANDNVRTSESVTPYTGNSESSFVDRESDKLKKDHRNVSYGGVRSKLIDSGSSNSLENVCVIYYLGILEIFKYLNVNIRKETSNLKLS